jgi:hypothetical protein
MAGSIAFLPADRMAQGPFTQRWLCRFAPIGYNNSGE